MATELFKSQGVDTPIHPGEILGEEIEVRAITLRELALQMRRPARGLTEHHQGTAASHCRVGTGPGAGARHLGTILDEPAVLL